MQLSVWAEMYQTLVTVSGLDWRIIPGLAESGENTDPLTWKFRLHPGVKFHNGQVLTAQDFAYSAGRILGTVDPKYPGFARRLYQDLIASVETPNDRTVIVKTRRPFASVASGNLSMNQCAIFTASAIHALSRASKAAPRAPTS